MTIHEEGRAIVWTGNLEIAELKKEQIESMGPDHEAMVKCDWPLGVILEPLP
jgi:ATP-dependent Clp protease adapter protein ClpS